MFDDILVTSNEENDSSIMAFLLRWKADIEEGIEDPLEYEQV